MSNLGILKEYPHLPANLAIHVSDLDVSSSYPSTEILLNVSKETTWRELSKIKGLGYWDQRAVSLNMTAPATNAVELCRTVMNFPSLDGMLEEFLADG